jgi:hypothetical protein
MRSTPGALEKPMVRSSSPRSDCVSRPGSSRVPIRYASAAHRYQLIRAKHAERAVVRDAAGARRDRGEHDDRRRLRVGRAVGLDLLVDARVEQRGADAAPHEAARLGHHGRHLPPESTQRRV